jgi:hypothetical protein
LTLITAPAYPFSVKGWESQKRSGFLASNDASTAIGRGVPHSEWASLEGGPAQAAG